jgi:hypothetical protein
MTHSPDFFMAHLAMLSVCRLHVLTERLPVAYVSWLLGLLFDPEVGSSAFRRNIVNLYHTTRPHNPEYNILDGHHSHSLRSSHGVTSILHIADTNWNTYLSIYLPIYGSTVLFVGPWPLFQFLNPIYSR